MTVARAAVVLLLLLGACAGRGPRAPIEPPEFDPPRREHGTEGLASWYGPGFHGRQTASGERYDQNDLTAAHKTLPFGTRVLVENLDNASSIWVRINDRGPFVSGRIIDLSRSAAEAIGLIGPGTARVRLRIRDGAAPSRGGQFLVQLGAFADPERARAVADAATQAGYPASLTRAGEVMRVRVGPYGDREAAEAVARALTDAGHSPMVVSATP